jgi:hypothetical protein
MDGTDFLYNSIGICLIYSKLKIKYHRSYPIGYPTILFLFNQFWERTLGTNIGIFFRFSNN